jgi:EmrB/QacA subfamily drug resistance transporter
MTLFFTSFLMSGVNIALPTIGQEFNADAIMIGWITTSATLVTAVLLLPLGRLADITGIKKMFAYGIALYTFSVAVSIFAISVEMLICCRIVTGIAGAMAVGNSFAIVSAAFPAGARGRALGILSAAVYIGMAVGPYLGGLLTEHFGWRSVFVMNVPCMLAVVILIFWKITGEWRGARGEKFDLSGSLLFGLAFMVLMYGLTILPTFLGFVLVSLGIIGLFGFWKLESRTPSPILDVKIFKNNRAFAFGNLAAMINYAATMAVIFLMSLYLQYIKGLSADLAGLVIMAKPVIQSCLSPVAGKLSDSVSPRKVASIGMAITCTGLVFLCFLNSATSLIYIIIVLSVMGVGLALFAPPNTNAIMGSVEPKYFGVASAMCSTSRQVGGMLSMAITMIILATFIGRAMITPQYYPSLLNGTRVAFIIFAGLSFFGIFASLARSKSR